MVPIRDEHDEGENYVGPDRRGEPSEDYHGVRRRQSDHFVDPPDLGRRHVHRRRADEQIVHTVDEVRGAAEEVRGKVIRMPTGTQIYTALSIAVLLLSGVMYVVQHMVTPSAVEENNAKLTQTDLRLQAEIDTLKIGTAVGARERAAQWSLQYLTMEYQCARDKATGKATYETDQLCKRADELSQRMSAQGLLQQ